VPESYKTVAARGYSAAAGEDFAFPDAMNGLTRIKHPMGLVENAPALLGLALGLRYHRNPHHLAWWEMQLRQLPATAPGKSFERFLENIRDPDQHPFLVKSLSRVLPGDAATESVNQEPLWRDEVLALASGILRPIPYWDKHELAQFLIVQRKSSFPYSDDFFFNMLTIRVEDFALAQMVLGPAERAADEARHLASIQDALAAWADRRAHRVASVLAIVATAVCFTLSFLFFVRWPDANELRDFWDVLKWATLGLGGPVPALVYLLPKFLGLLRGGAWKLDFSWIQQKISLGIVHRWQRRLMLPLTI
jgi:hypothetical protein